MKTTVNFCDFCDRFRDMGRNDAFSYEGKRALFEYLEQYEEDCVEEIELDVIALCCDYSEHASAVDCVNDIGYDLSLEGEDDDEREKFALAWLRDNTQVIEFDGGIIIQGF